MAVIKANVAPLITPFSIKDMETQAQSVLLRAKQAAAEIIRKAQHEVEEARKSAMAEGIAEGRADGLTRGLEEGRRSGHQAALAELKPQLNETWTALTTAAEKLEQSRAELEAAGVAEVVQLAAAIARRVTKRQAALDPAVLVENVKAAMQLAVGAADVTVAIHPSQKQILDHELPKLRLTWPHLKHVQIVEDEAVTAGGCVVRTGTGEIDARIDEQLDRVIAELMPAT